MDHAPPPPLNQEKTMRRPEYVVEKDVPVRNNHGSPFNILFDMEDGDSFLVQYISQRESARTFAKNNGFRITTRQEPDGMYRIWKGDIRPRRL